MYQKSDQAFINYHGYEWGRLNQLYRGPRPDLSRPYVACIGGGQTFGRYVDHPFPELLSREIGMTVANLGTPNAGPGFFLRDSVALEAASKAEVCIVQVMSARALSNRLFKVQLNSAAQIETVSKALESLFPHVDFETFTYAHNMLNQLSENDPDSFLAVEAELRAAWVARTRSLLQSIQTKRILFWFSERAPDDKSEPDSKGSMLSYPQFVDQEMLDAAAPLVDEIVYCVSSRGYPHSLLKDGETVLQTPFGMPVRENLFYPSPEMHIDAAKALAGPVRALLGADTPARACDRPDRVTI